MNQYNNTATVSTFEPGLRVVSSVARGGDGVLSSRWLCPGAQHVIKQQHPQIRHGFCDKLSVHAL